MRIEHTIEVAGVKITQRVEIEGAQVVNAADNEAVPSAATPREQSATLPSHASATPKTNRPDTPGPRKDRGGETEKKDPGGGRPGAGVVVIVGPIVCVTRGSNDEGGETEKKDPGGAGKKQTSGETYTPPTQSQR